MDLIRLDGIGIKKKDELDLGGIICATETSVLLGITLFPEYNKENIITAFDGHALLLGGKEFYRPVTLEVSKYNARLNPETVNLIIKKGRINKVGAQLRIKYNCRAKLVGIELLELQSSKMDLCHEDATDLELVLKKLGSLEPTYSTIPPGTKEKIRENAKNFHLFPPLLDHNQSGLPSESLKTYWKIKSISLESEVKSLVLWHGRQNGLDYYSGKMNRCGIKISGALPRTKPNYKYTVWFKAKPSCVSVNLRSVSVAGVPYFLVGSVDPLSIDGSFTVYGRETEPITGFGICGSRSTYFEYYTDIPFIVQPIYSEDGTLKEFKGHPLGVGKVFDKLQVINKI